MHRHRPKSESMASRAMAAIRYRRERKAWKAAARRIVAEYPVR